MIAQRMIGVAASLLLAWVAAAGGETVKDVRIRASGAVPVDTNLVSSYLGVRAGMELDRNSIASAIANDVRNLLASGRFSNVQGKIDTGAGGITVTYEVGPKLKLIAPVTVIGVEELSESRVRDLLGLGAGDYVDDPTIAARVVKLKDEYRKRLYAEAEITWTLESKPSDVARGLATVAVTVKEGPRTSVRKVVFPGHRAVEYRALRLAMDVPAWYTPIGWFRRTPYNVEDIEAGCERVAAVYKERGYLDIKVEKPTTREVYPGRLLVIIPVIEGIQYKVARVSVSRNKLYPEAELKRAAGLKPGTVASMTTIQKAADAIRDYYESRGYLRTGVTPLLDLRDRAGDVDVCFEVREGRLTHVNNVIIRGNKITKDKVIRRELLVYPGEQYDGVRTRKSENRLRGLNYFSNVNSYDEPTGVSNRSDMVFEVEEKPTGLFTAGVGYSSVDSLIGFAEVSQGNFDINGWPFLGGGQKVRLRAEFGSRREDYSISFVEPWFMNRRLSLGLELYSTRRDNRDYDILRQGGAVSLGVPLLGPNRLDLKYRLERVETRSVSDTNAYQIIGSTDDTAFYFNDPRRMASSVAATLTHDTRDNTFVPTRGLRTFLTGTLMGGALGGDTDLYDIELGGNYYVPLWWQHVLSFRARAEVVDTYGDTEEVPLSERQFAGGSRTVRGFRTRWVGPKAERADGTGTVRPCGGQSLAVASAEYTIPLVSKIRFATFYDIGNVWLDAYEFEGSNLAAGAGIGLRLDIPGFPMRFDYAWPVETDGTRSQTERVSFWIGYDF